MRLDQTPNLSNITDVASLIKYLTPFVTQVAQIFNGNVGFTDNIKLTTVSVTFPSADTNVTTNHKLGTIPNNYIVTSATAPLSVYAGTSPNTGSVLNLRANGSGTVTLLIF